MREVNVDCNVVGWYQSSFMGYTHLTEQMVRWQASYQVRRVRPRAIQKGTRVLISLWDSLMFGRVPGTRPNISESHSEIRTRVPFCIAGADRSAATRCAQSTRRRAPQATPITSRASCHRADDPPLAAFAWRAPATTGPAPLVRLPRVRPAALDPLGALAEGVPPYGQVHGDEQGEEVCDEGRRRARRAHFRAAAAPRTEQPPRAGTSSHHVLASRTHLARCFSVESRVHTKAHPFASIVK